MPILMQYLYLSQCDVSAVKKERVEDFLREKRFKMRQFLRRKDLMMNIIYIKMFILVKFQLKIQEIKDVLKQF